MSARLAVLSSFQSALRPCSNERCSICSMLSPAGPAPFMALNATHLWVPSFSRASSSCAGGRWVCRGVCWGGSRQGQVGCRERAQRCTAGPGQAAVPCALHDTPPLG